MLARARTKAQARAAIDAARRDGTRIALVPTMGALHDGHISLVRAAREQAGYVVVSIFVNPTQFGPGEDFDAYPRRLEADIELLAAEGVDLVVTPTTDEMYGADPQVTVDPGPLAARWEGEARTGHLQGVATIVTKLFNALRPDIAFFGEKDFQQLRIVEQLADDLDTGVAVVGLPTVREADGLALSSRNSYLSAEERERALGLSSALEAVANAAAVGERDGATLTARMREVALSSGVVLDYAAVVDAATLEPLGVLVAPARALIAGRVGSTRLIDNRELVPARLPLSASTASSRE